MSFPRTSDRAQTLSSSYSSNHGNDDDEYSEPKHGDLFWAKMGSHPWWPSMIYKDEKGSVVEMRGKGNKRKAVFRVLFFGNYTHSWLPKDDLEPFKGKKEFMIRLRYLRAQHNTKKYSMNINNRNQEYFMLALHMAENLLRLPSMEERLLKVETVWNEWNKNFGWDEGGEQVIDIEEDADEALRDGGKDASILHTSFQIQNILPVTPKKSDEQFMLTMLTSPSRFTRSQSKKRKLADDDDNDASKARKSENAFNIHKVKNEPGAWQSPFELPTLPPSPVIGDDEEEEQQQPPLFSYCSHFVCSPLSSAEERYIMKALEKGGPFCSFVKAKELAEREYENIQTVNIGSGCSVPIYEHWFAHFLYKHMHELAPTYPHWLSELDLTSTPLTFEGKIHRAQLLAVMALYIHT